MDSGLKELEAGRVQEVARVTWWGLAANLLLATIKFVVGFLGKSQALVADAVHSLADSSTDIAILVGSSYWSRPADDTHPHGHGRIETMVTVLIGSFLVFVGVGLALRALTSLQLGEPASPGWLVFAVACISIVGKEWLYLWTVRVGRRVRSQALIANAWHHRSDAVSSVPVVFAVIGSRIYPGWLFLDAVAALIVSLLVLHASWQILWPALKELADTGASRQERDALRELAQSVDGVRNVHALRTRNIGTGFQVDLHVLVDPDLTVREGHAISHQVEDTLRNKGPNVVDVLIHIEPDE